MSKRKKFPQFVVSGEDKHQSLGNYVYKRYVNHSLGGMISNILRYMYFYRKYIENLIYIIIIHIITRQFSTILDPVILKYEIYT